MIVIISAPEDIHAQAVIRALSDQGVSDVTLLNFREFPSQMTMEMRLDHDQGHFALRLEGGTHLALHEVTAFWWRRPQGFGIPTTITDPAYRQFAMSEAATAFQGMWQASQALWVNNIVRDAAAAHKPWQLELARRLGLTIPETLITNDPALVQDFWHEHAGEVIYKAFSATHYAWRETRLLRPEELQLAETIRLAPVIFQRYVSALVDLRITVIGNQIFAAEADSQTGEYKIDVRFNQNITYRPHTLPPQVESMLLQLMRQLGLEYGAIDMRLTPEGDYVFLEINPAGQFLYVEEAAGLPIAAALAAHLARGVPTEVTETASEKSG